MVEIEEIAGHLSLRRRRDELWQFVSELRGPLSLAARAARRRAASSVRAAIEERVPAGADGGYELAGVSINVLAR